MNKSYQNYALALDQLDQVVIHINFTKISKHSQKYVLIVSSLSNILTDKWRPLSVYLDNKNSNELHACRLYKGGLWSAWTHLDPLGYVAQVERVLEVTGGILPDLGNLHHLAQLLQVA